MKGFILFISLCVIAIPVLAQDKNYDLSPAIDISETGWNKILQLANGNTLLFHFENKKGVLVKVFDKNHVEVASETATGSHINLQALEQSFFDGLYDINNEAVLFITQRINGTESLYRLRFDPNSGKLVNEENVTELSGFAKNTTAFVLKEASEDMYYIVAFTRGSIEDANLILHIYDKKHMHLKQIPLGMVKKGYDYIHLLSQEIDKKGSILVTTELDKIIQYPDITEKYIVLYYLPKGATQFSARVLKMPQGAKDFNIKFSENTYAETINIFLSSLLQQPSVKGQESSVFFYKMMLIADREMNALNQVDLDNNNIKTHLQKHIKNEPAYAGNILKVNTNKKGNTTVIEEDLLSKTEDNGSNAAYIGITEYDYEGNEKWATVLPKTLTSNPKYNHPSSEVFKVRTSAYELSQVLCLNTKHDQYILFNDLNNNFNKEIGTKFDPITDYSYTNTVYYKLNRKNEITKSYLFGPYTDGEYKYIYTHSGDFNDRKNLYATVMLYNKEGKTTTHIAWCKIDN